MNEDVTVREVMDRAYVGVSESDGLVETAALLLEEDADTAVVLRGSEPVGALTCRDVVALLVDGPDPHTATVSDAMTTTVHTVSPDLRIEAAADEMSAMDARRLVVTAENGDEPLGVITEHDVLRTRPLGSTRAERQAIGDHPAGETGVSPTQGAERTRDGPAGFEDQSICERCGTLTSDLSSFNGQLLCSDCRNM